MTTSAADATPSLDELTRLRRARDRIDREFATDLDVAAVAATAHMSSAHFTRRFKVAYGETPHQHFMRRRIERSMALLRGGESVTDACMRVGCASLGSFSASFTAIVGMSPTAYRALDHSALMAMPACEVRAVARPVSGRGSPVGGASSIEQESRSRPTASAPTLEP